MEKDTFKTLSDRLLHVLELTGTKKADLARAIGVQPQTIQHLCYGNVMASRFTFELATVLGLNTRWLATGEGEMFLADDPKNKLFKEYKKIPLLNNEQLIALAKEEGVSENETTAWAVLKTQESNIFCTYMGDSSMLPSFQQNAKIFFKETSKSSREKITNGAIVIAYLPQFYSLMVREIRLKNSCIYLSPQNKNLFKEFELTDDVIIFGEAIECHFTININKR